MGILIRNTTNNEYISSDKFDETINRHAAHEDKLGVLTGLLFLITNPRENHNSSYGFFGEVHSNRAGLTYSDPLLKSFLGRWCNQQIEHIPETLAVTSAITRNSYTNISDEVVYCLLLDPLIRKFWAARINISPPRKDLEQLIELGATKDEDLILLNGKYKDLPAIQHLYNLRLDYWAGL